MIRALIVDCFGVLTEDGWLAFKKKYVNPDLESTASQINAQNDRGVLPYKEYLSELSKITGVAVSEIDELIHPDHHRNTRLLTLLRNLKTKYKIGMLSNVSHNYLGDFLTPEDLTLFDALGLSGETGYIKPEPSAYTDICQKLDILPEEAVFIDDRAGYVEGAKRLNMQALLYQDYDQVYHDLQELGVFETK